MGKLVQDLSKFFGCGDGDFSHQDLAMDLADQR